MDWIFQTVSSVSDFKFDQPEPVLILESNNKLFDLILLYWLAGDDLIFISFVGRLKQRKPKYYLKI